MALEFRQQVFSTDPIARGVPILALGWQGFGLTWTVGFKPDYKPGEEHAPQGRAELSPKQPSLSPTPSRYITGNNL